MNRSHLETRQIRRKFSIPKIVTNKEQLTHPLVKRLRWKSKHRIAFRLSGYERVTSRVPWWCRSKVQLENSIISIDSLLSTVQFAWCCLFQPSCWREVLASLSPAVFDGISEFNKLQKYSLFHSTVYQQNLKPQANTNASFPLCALSPTRPKLSLKP